MIASVIGRGLQQYSSNFVETLDESWGFFISYLSSQPSCPSFSVLLLSFVESRIFCRFCFVSVDGVIINIAWGGRLTGVSTNVTAIVAVFSY